MNNFDKLRVLRKAGRVRRFHTREVVREENVAEHSFNSLLALLFVVPNWTPQLVEYILTHDLAEREIGDIPSPIKREVKMRGDNFLEVAEVQWLSKHLPKRTVAEHLLGDNGMASAKLVDNLDGLMKCIEELEAGNKDLIHVGEQYCLYLKDYESAPVVKEAIEYFKSIRHDHRPIRR